MNLNKWHNCPEKDMKCGSPLATYCLLLKIDPDRIPTQKHLLLWALKMVEAKEMHSGYIQFVYVTVTNLYVNQMKPTGIK